MTFKVKTMVSRSNHIIFKYIFNIIINKKKYIYGSYIEIKNIFLIRINRTIGGDKGGL